jgi:hypothetical protein
VENMRSKEPRLERCQRFGQLKKNKVGEIVLSAVVGRRSEEAKVYCG